MLETSQPWSLFGYDLRRVPHYFRAGWRDFLWGSESPVLGAFDEMVEVYQESGEVLYYQAGNPVAAPAVAGSVAAQAVLLPERLVLVKTLRVPVVAEADLESVASLEVRSSSPFPADDTCYGWAIGERREKDMDVHLVISSQSAAMAFIASLLDCHDVTAYEVWARAGDRMVLLSGFGEAGRQQRNRRRLTRIALMLVYCLAAVLAMFALGAGAKYLELQKVRAIHSEVEQRAGDAVELRAGLVSAKDDIATVNDLLAEYPAPHVELSKLASILGDDTWVSAAEIKGMQIKIEGESRDAAAVMQQLLDDPAYARVTAPVAIKKVRSGMERFVLNLTLATETDSE